MPTDSIRFSNEAPTVEPAAHQPPIGAVEGQTNRYDEILFTSDVRSSAADAARAASPVPIFLAPPPCLASPSELVKTAAVAARENIGDAPSLPVWSFRQFCLGIEWCFGLVCLMYFLAQLSTYPLLQFISLGCLLEMSGRIARTGRFRDGFVQVRNAARLGSIFFGAWLFLWICRYVSYLSYTSSLIDDSSGATRGLRLTFLIVTAATLGHILSAWYCGGRLRHFFWPLLAPFQFAGHILRGLAGSKLFRPVLDYTIGLVSPRLVQDICDSQPLTDWFVPAIVWKALTTGKIYTTARDAVWEFVVGLELPYYFGLGLRGFAGAVVWLIVPIMFMIGATSLPTGLDMLSGFVGVVLLSLVVLYLPFLQAHFAAENRLRAMFALGEIRRAFCRAPIAFWLALVVTLVSAVPLFLLKIEFLLTEVTWVASLVFVVFMTPARLITGWAVARARKAPEKRFFLFRWLSRLGGLPFAVAYALIVLATPFVLWYGKWSLLEQHAFLIPAPFIDM